MKRMRKSAPRRRQGGVVLVMTLIVLVALTLATLALVRSVDTSGLIAGNLAFKQSAAISSDAGVEAAVAWLGAEAASLERDKPEDGYYASSQDSIDLTGNLTPQEKDDNLDWEEEDGVQTLAKDKAGNVVSYVIHRLCETAGPLDADKCSTEQSDMGGSSLGGNRQMHAYQPGSWDMVANRAFYRITVRVSGPRSNVSYAQAVISQ